MLTASDGILRPRGAPGRSKAKARAFESEIARLYAEGYTCKAIREALADVGVTVSDSCIRRELARRPRPVSEGSQRQDTATSARLSLAASSHRSGKEIAESFMNGRITNPLLRHRD